MIRAVFCIFISSNLNPKITKHAVKYLERGSQFMSNYEIGSGVNKSYHQYKVL
jgi:hypothetical protein